VNWSAELVALVPELVIAVTSTTPTDPAGERTTTSVDETTIGFGAETVPNLIAVAPVKSVPVIVTAVPPAGRPAAGLTAVIVGASWYVNWSSTEVELVPSGVVTVTSTVPRTPAGEVAVICVGKLTV
jgi:hypothetical protein